MSLLESDPRYFCVTGGVYSDDASIGSLEVIVTSCWVVSTGFEILTEALSDFGPGEHASPIFGLCDVAVTELHMRIIDVAYSGLCGGR